MRERTAGVENMKIVAALLFLGVAAKDDHFPPCHGGSVRQSPHGRAAPYHRKLPQLGICLLSEHTNGNVVMGTNQC